MDLAIPGASHERRQRTVRDEGPLEFLRDGNLIFEDVERDVRRRIVTIVGGDDVGHVDDLLVEPAHRVVRYLVVGSGGILGIGRRRQMVSVDSIVGLEPDRVLIAAPESEIRARMLYRPVLIERPAAEPQFLVLAVGPIVPYRYVTAVHRPDPAADRAAGDASAVSSVADTHDLEQVCKGVRA